MSNDSVAIIGMALRVPGAETISEFWQLLCEGKDALERPAGFQTEDDLATDTERFVPVCGRLRNVREFDHEFFGFRKDEAELLDPQQRLLLECSWEALEQAGWATRRDSRAIGMFGSVGFQSYLIDNVSPSRSIRKDVDRLDVMLATDKDFAASRIAYKLSLTGPAITVQAACASSLAAVHVAVQSLLLGDCDMALAGGAAVDTSRQGGYHYMPGLILSPEGRVRSYDRNARGTVPSAGVGVVLLKRLAEAEADGDPIHAVVHGTALTNDGGQRAGFTAPTIAGIERAAAHALAVSGLAPRSIGYVEGHGSGTPLGDSTELRGLTAAYGEPGRASCWLGSVKSNIGHLDVAAGIAGFIKAALVAYHGTVPPSLNCREPLAEFDRDECFFRVARSIERLTPEAPFAGVSSLGLGGQNVHAVLGPPPASVRTAASQSPVMLAWTDRSQAATPSMSAKLAASLEGGVEAQDLGFSLAMAGPRGPCRSAALWLPEEPNALTPIASACTGDGVRTTIGCFPGYGARFTFDTRNGSLQQIPTARDIIERAFAAWPSDLAVGSVDTLRDALAAKPGTVRDDSADGHAIEHAAHLVACTATAQQAVAWGLDARRWSGYSLGEYPAAVMAGILSLEDALRLVIVRALAAARSSAPGKLLAAAESAAFLADFLGDDVHLAIDGGPDYCVAGGGDEAIARLATALNGRDVAAQVLPGNLAFHTPLIGRTADFAALLETVDLSPGNGRFDSGLLGMTGAGADAATPAYWTRHLSETLRYRELLEQQMATGAATLVEFGPDGALTALARRTAGRRYLDGTVQAVAITSDEPDRQERGLMTGLARAWCSGADVDWSRHFSVVHPDARKVWLPTTEFQREECWIEPLRHAPPAASSDTWTTDWIPVETPAALGACTVCTLDLGAGLPSDSNAVLNYDAGRDSFVDGSGRAVEASSGGIAEVLLARGVDLPLVILVRVREEEDGELDHAPRLAAALSLLATALDEIGGTRFIVLAERAYLIRPGDRASPIGQMLAACTTVVDQELPRITATFIDVGLVGPDSSVAAPDLHRPGVFALRDQRLLLREIVPQPLSAVQPRHLRNGGTYLVSGAGGSIGRRLCHHLAEHFEATVIAVGRSRIEPAGPMPSRGEIVTLVADVEDTHSLRSAFVAAALTADGFDGVFHLAGVTQEVDLVGRQSAKDLARLMAARCGGMLAIEQLFAEREPDFLVVFSSTASVLGGAGLYGYSASCALADGLAERYASAGRNWLSVGWDGWATSRSTGQLELESTFFSEDEALTLLDRLLVRGRTGHLLCMRGNPALRAARARTSFRPAARAAEADYDPATTSDEPIVTEMAALWAQLMGRPVAPDEDFFRLGGDSLLAVKLSSAIRKQWSVRAPMSLFMEKATPRDLALYVEDRLGRPSDAPSIATVEPPRAADTEEPRLRDFNDALRRWARLVMADVYETISSPAQVIAQHQRLFGYVQEIVEEDPSLTDLGSAQRQCERQACEADLIERAGDTVYRSVFRGLFALGGAFAEILKGEESGVYLMFEGDEDSLASQAYRRLPEAAETLDRMAELVTGLDIPEGRPLRVLEIGAGLGVATERVVPNLPPDTEYVFTDISASFFPAILQRFPQLRCEVLDLDSPVAQLSGGTEQFDLILGSNALHCAASLSHSIERLASMLAPGGAVVLMETINNEPWHLIAMGTLPGFLSCEDFRAALAGPFAPLAAWRKLWGQAGLEVELSPDEARRAEELGQTAFVIRRAPAA